MTTGLASLKVELGFGSDPLGTITYTDVTADVHSVTTDRGRTTALDQFQPGKATITIKNDAAKYDPLNASGPYYGDLVPMVPVRVSMNDSTTTRRNLFTGYVKPRGGWQYAYDGPNRSVATINCEDFFAVLATLTLPAVFPIYPAYKSGAQLQQLVTNGVIPSPAAGWSIDTGQIVLQAYAGGVNALQHVQTLATAEVGAFYVDRDGVAQFDERYAPLKVTRQKTSQVTFDDSGSNVPYAADSFAMDYANLIYNGAQYGVQGGATASAEDATSITKYTETDFTASGLPIQNINDAQANATFLVAQYKTPVATPSALRLRPLVSNTILDASIKRETRDRATVKFKAPGASTQITAVVFVERIVHTITASTGDFTTDLQFSPVRYGFTNFSDYLVLDDATFGLLNTAKLGF